MKILILFEYLLNMYMASCFIVPSGKEPECPGVDCRPIDYKTCTCPCETIPFCSENDKSDWPLGNYGLPPSIYGCPEDGWEIRYINMTLFSDSVDMFWESSGTNFFYSLPWSSYTWSHNKDLHILGPYSKKNFQLNFCVRQGEALNVDMGLRGNFCMYKMGRECDSGFEEGNVTIRGYKTDVRGFSSNVTTTDGGVVVSFCCRNDNTSNLSDMLPQSSSFVLIKGPSANFCEFIQNMTVTEDVMYLSVKDRDADFQGILPNITSSESHLKISFCVYFPLDYEKTVISGEPWHDESDLFDISDLRQTDLLCSKRKPCYSYLYPRTEFNDIKFVVDGDVEGNLFTFTTYSVHRPWLQIDHQEFVYVQHVLKITDESGLVSDIGLYGVYVSKEQWDFINHGAVACFFGVSKNKFVCRRPVIGQYVTIVREEDYNIWIDQILELEVYGIRLKCGRPLGMISGDIKDFQIETSSNHQDTQYSRALQGNRGWCTSQEDKEGWIMVDLILPTRIQGITLHGWFQNKVMFMNSFMVEYGVRQNNMTLYNEPGHIPKVFKIDTSQNVNVMQKFWFFKEITARFLKIIIVEPNQDIACVKLEIIGCDRFYRRTINCDQEQSIDFGFATRRHMSFDYENNVLKWAYKLCDESEDMSLEKCQQLTIEKEFLGNMYKEKKCWLYNVISTNRHYKHLWTQVPDIGSIVSERLCFRDLMTSPSTAKTEFVLPELGATRDIHSLMFPSSYPRGYSWKETYHSSMFLKLTIVYVFLAETATKTDLEQAGHSEIHPGYCEEKLHIYFGNERHIEIVRQDQNMKRHAFFISKGHTIDIVFESCIPYTTSTDNNVYELKIETVEHPGCGIGGFDVAVCTDRSAYIASSLNPLPNTFSASISWRIRGEFGQYIALKFIDLDLMYSANHDDSFVEVIDYGVDNTILSKGRYYMETKPPGLLLSSWHMMDVEFRVGDERMIKGFFGLYSIVDIVSNSFLNSSGCIDNWRGFQNSCYTVFERQIIDQQNAELECVRNDGHLVSISSEEEMTFVHRLLIEISGNKTTGGSVPKVYIGLTKKNRGYLSSDFQWSNGEPLIYSAWFSGKGKLSQPDGFDSEQCTAIILDSIHNKHNWHDVPCAFDQIHYFMCESHPYINETTEMDSKLQSKLYSSIPVLTENMKRCDNGEIVSQFVVCDGYPDCSDKSDEFNCDKTGCTSAQFKCDNNQCVDLTFYCDGISHCDDASDENDCELPPCKEDDEWQCENKHCIPKDKRCDRKEDCYDKSDEHNCVSCNSNSYKCYDQTCISPARKCDVLPDCPGRYFEDETDCANYNVQRSCGDWWNLGFRADGMYRIDNGETYSFIVYCQFTEMVDKVLTSTSLIFNENQRTILGQIEFKHFEIPLDMIKSMSHSQEYTCSQKIQLTCYFYDALGPGRSMEPFLRASNDRTQCMRNDWSRADVNKVVVEDMIFKYPSDLPAPIDYVENLPSYSDEGFYMAKKEPVVCVSEISKNISSEKFKCTNGNLYDTAQRCIMRFYENKDIMGCRDLSHLQHCDDFVCPESFFKCTDGYCLSPNLVCDGIKQCRKGEDELICDNMTCSGLFRCQKSTTCLLHDDVCNGIRDCPYGDDEMACNITCPAECDCHGLVIVCQYNVLENKTLTVPNQARKLDLSNSILPSKRTKLVFSFLAELILFNCSVEYIEEYAFTSLENLLLLDLRKNRFKILRRNMFHGLNRLRTLKLAGNKLLTRIEPTTFTSLVNVRQLHLIDTGIQRIEDATFSGLSKLEKLNISNNDILSVQQNAFYGLDSLISIDLSNNEITEYTLEIFSSLHNLFEMRSDSYTFCCLKPESVSPEKCFPQMDEFSSCTDLMRDGMLRICLWIIGILALVGNLGVLVFRFINERNMLGKAHGFFVVNLGLSDLLMGVYLCIIAVADLYFKGDYILHDREWRESGICKTAGVLAAVSCEASVNFILLITIDCFLMVKFPFGNRRINKTMARVLSVTCWLLVVLIGVFPLLYTSDFSQSYYSKTSVCLALPFSRHKSNGWEYSTIIFVFYNCFAIMIIACCQICIYNAAKSGNRMMAKRTKKDLALARRLFLVVLTDFMCWVPVGVMGILALTGEVFPADVYSWVAVFVMPINAALNPFLYTFSNVWTKKKEKIMSSVSTTMFKVTKMKQNSKDSTDNIFVASTFVESMQKLTPTYISLRDLFTERKISPKESYLLCTQLITALTFLHQRFLTFRKRIFPENVVVLIEDEVIIRIKIISKVRGVKKDEDASQDVEDIGMLAKQILRYTLPPGPNITRL